MSGHPSRMQRWLPAVLLTCAAVSGCAQVIGLDKEYREESAAIGAQDAGCPKPDAALADPTTCPTFGADVAQMKALPGGYCIDVTEVTWAQYKAWLATSPAGSAEPACAWNATFEPKDLQPGDPGSDSWPVAGVDWCDAFEYCKQNDKRLCGKIGASSAVPFDGCAYQDYTQDQWYNACSAGGAQTYTWGNDVKDKSCNGGNNLKTTPVAVGSMSGCMSGALAYNDIFDLTGNVLEWEDSCDDTKGATDQCRVRGGYFQSDDQQLRCDYDYSQDRSIQRSFLGFRCCSK